MYLGKTVSVVVPAFNEELLIEKTISSMPEYVDKIIVVNDGSTDKTDKIISSLALNNSRILMLTHPQNCGLGQSLIDGYIKALELNLDIIAIMAGDAQMNPDDLTRVLEPLVQGQADYAKGNRLFHNDVWQRMPKHRFIGNNILTLLTKFATGYWHLIDPQCGYTAISHKALKGIPIEKMIKGYGYNAHILNMLNLNNMKVADVEVEPVYGEEQSKIKLYKYIPTVSLLLLKLFLKRITRKYLVREFSPIALFYLNFASCFFVSFILLIRLIILYSRYDVIPTTTLILLSFCSLMGWFSLSFGIWLDIEDNRHLRPHAQR